MFNYKIYSQVTFQFMLASLHFFLNSIEQWQKSNPAAFTMSSMGVLIIQAADEQIYCTSTSCECQEFKDGQFCWHRLAFNYLASKKEQGNENML